MTADYEQIARDVRENSKKLESCALHEFTRHNPNENVLRARFVCSNCGGTVDLQRYVWYTKGLEHARKAVSR